MCRFRLENFKKSICFVQGPIYNCCRNHLISFFVLTFYQQHDDSSVWDYKVLCTNFFQENLKMVIKNGQHKLVGFVELGAADDHIEKIIGEIFAIKLFNCGAIM